MTLGVLIYFFSRIFLTTKIKYLKIIINPIKNEIIMINDISPAKYLIRERPIRPIANEMYNILKLLPVSIVLPHLESIDITSIMVAKIVIGAYIAL